MESTTITYAGMTIDIDYEVDKHGDLECITDVTHEGVSIKDFCDSVSVRAPFSTSYDDLTYTLEQMVQAEIVNGKKPDEFEGYRVGQ
jgi:hypothetical protein